MIQNKVAVVAGATRGAGRGVAVELGAAGMTVYCTGRSVRGAPSDLGRPETIEGTAERVTAAGGVGIPVQVDHTVEAEVQALFERVGEEQGRLDLLVNDIWGGDSLIEWGKPFWEQDVGRGLTVLERAVMTHIITSRYGVPLMLEQNAGLVIEVTDGDGWFYHDTLYYDLSKKAAMRLAFAMHEEFRIHNKSITAVALTPGFLRSEAMLENFGVTEENWTEGAKQDPFFAGSETPHYIGRAVVALASDPKIAEKSGQTLATWNLAREYGFTDLDGRQPHWKEFFAEQQAVLESGPKPES